jgi:heat-inducible transcriptional repressor
MARILMDERTNERVGNQPSERQQALLGLIVREYVGTKQPVGSDTIVRKYWPSISPATVRNDMVALAAEGYICNTHTSSGRIPTDAGYRFYVRSLMRPAELGADERRMIDHQFHQIERDLDQWTRLAATVLAQLTENAAFVTLPIGRHSRLRHVDLIATQDRSALLVALLQEGTLHQQLVVQSEVVPQDQLDRTARRITRELSGSVAVDVDRWANAESPLDLAVRETLVGLLRRVEQQSASEVWYDGVSYLLSQPEFARPDKALDVLRAFEQRLVLLEIAEGVKDHDGVRVLVGDENSSPVLRDCAVLATRYGRGSAAGVIGIVGPTRVRYDRIIATLQYLSGLLTGLWAELCG